MRKLWVLVKVNFKQLVLAFSFGSTKGRKLSGAGAMALMCFLALYMSGMYNAMMGSAFAQLGMLDFLLPMMSLLAALAALFFTVFAASGIVFGSKDSDLMLSLPVPAFSVMLAKLLALYLENLVFCVLWMLPAAVVSCMFGGFDAMLIVRIALASLFLPFVPSLLAMVLGYFIAWLNAKTANSALLANIFYFVFIAVVMAGSMGINQLPNLILTNRALVEQLFRTWLLPFGLLQQAAVGNNGALLGFVAICVLPFFALVFAVSTQYKAILSGLAARKLKNNYKLGKLETRSQYGALLKKELARYFGTPIYFFNTGIGSVMMLLAAGACVVMRGTILEFLPLLGGTEIIVPYLSSILLFCACMTCVTCVSISLEGKTLWILKEAPIAASVLFQAKLSVQLLVGIPAMLVLAGVGCAALALPVWPVACAVLGCAAMVLFNGVFGLWVNLMFPKMDGINDTVVVKQSAASMIAIFGSMGIAGLIVLLYFLCMSWLPFWLLCLACGASFCIVSALLWKWLCTKGAQKLLTL